MYSFSWIINWFCFTSRNFLASFETQLFCFSKLLFPYTTNHIFICICFYSMRYFSMASLKCWWNLWWQAREASKKWPCPIPAHDNWWKSFQMDTKRPNWLSMAPKGCLPPWAWNQCFEGTFHFVAPSQLYTKKAKLNWPRNNFENFTLHTYNPLFFGLPVPGMQQ